MLIIVKKYINIHKHLSKKMPPPKIQWNIDSQTKKNPNQ